MAAPPSGSVFWVALATPDADAAFTAGPFAELGDALTEGRRAARDADQNGFLVAEFDEHGRQISPATPWPADSLAPDKSGHDAETATDSAAATGGAEVIFTTPAIDETAPTPSSRWAHKRRQRRRSAGRATVAVGRRSRRR